MRSPRHPHPCFTIAATLLALLIVTTSTPAKTRDEWLRMMSVGPIGYATMVQNVVPAMRAQGGGAVPIWELRR